MVPSPINPKKGEAADAAAPMMVHLDRVQRGLEDVARLVDQQERLVVLGTMAAAIAHEINNILTPVKAYAELALANPGETGLVVKALERAAQGVDRATRIAEMILATARPGTPQIRGDTDSGQEDGDPGGAPVPPGVSERDRGGAPGGLPVPRADVREVVTRAVGALPPDEGGMWRVEVGVPRGLGAAMDPVALEQVLINLLLNARGAMPDGGTITIRARRGGARKDVVSTTIAIEVEDIGCGIPAEMLEAVFGAFVSGVNEKASEKAPSGLAALDHLPRPERRGRSGLGLAICRKLVGDAGGRIEAESVVGKGTRVRIVVPSTGERRAAA